jgi:hypothetical protein
MVLRRGNAFICLATACLALAFVGPSRAQYGTLANAGYPTIDLYGHGYGSTPVGGYGAFPNGYAPLNGAMGSGYQGAGQLYDQAAQAAVPVAPNATRPVFDVTTATPGWYTPARRARRRLRAQPNAVQALPFDDGGKIEWPKTIADLPSIAALRAAAEAAVRTVAQESKTNGHASVRGVIDAKNKLTALERKSLPEIKSKNPADASAVETFFLNLDRALDALTFMK